MQSAFFLFPTAKNSCEKTLALLSIINTMENGIRKKASAPPAETLFSVLSPPTFVNGAA